MAIYNLKDSKKVEQITAYMSKLISDGAMVELKRITTKRTLDQNAYIHVLFNLFGLEFGYTLTEAKTIVKRHFADIFVYEKNGTKFLGHTSEMNTKQMTDFIDRFRRWSESEGCYLPTPDEYRGKYDYYQNIVNINREFL